MQQSYQCPYCGETLEQGARFCGNCGRGLDWSNQRFQPSSTGNISNIPRNETHETGKILKIIGVSIVSVLLFISLLIFGPAFTLNQTALNPDFVTSEVNRLELAPLANYFVTQNLPKNLLDTAGIDVTGTINRLEPTLKQQINVSINSVYDYLLGKRESLNLPQLLRSSFLSTDVVTALIDNTDVATAFKPAIHDQVSHWIPAEAAFLNPYIYTSIDETLANQASLFKGLLINDASQIADFLSGQQSGFSLSIPTKPFIDGLKTTLLKDITESKIPELAQFPTGIVEEGFNQVFAGLSFPDSIEINQDMIGKDTSGNIKAALSSAENTFTQIKGYISSFRIWYVVLIVFMALLCAGIFLIYREIKGATRTLGAVFLAYAIVELIFFLVIGNIAGSQLGKLLAGAPVQLQQWATQTLNQLLFPMEMLSLGFLAAGVVLIVVSFVYKRRNQVSSLYLPD